MESQIVNIPANFTDAGKFLGLFEIRNTVEAVTLALPIVFIFFFVLPFPLNIKIISCAMFLIPVCGFALIGVQDSSLVTFIKNYIKWRRNRRILSVEGGGTK